MRLWKCTQGLSSYHPTERAKIIGVWWETRGPRLLIALLTALYFLVFLFDRWTRGVNRKAGRQHKTEAWTVYLCGVWIVAGTSHCPVLCLCCCCLYIFRFWPREHFHPDLPILSVGRASVTRGLYWSVAVFRNVTITRLCPPYWKSKTRLLLKMSLLNKKKKSFIGVPAPLGYVPGLGRG